MREYIRVCDIEKYYGTGRTVTKAVDRVSFTVEQGEFVGVMGASGSGKTTLLNMLSTIDRVTAGHIYYENTDITELSEDQVAEFRKKNLGFVFQEYNLLDTLTLEENVMLAMSLRKEKKSVIEKQCQDMLNKTSSAIRVTHIPTGTVVECQNERSQFQNKDKALEILRSRLLAQKQKEQQDAINDDRAGQVGTGDRSEKIRTYNFPQDRCTDHRIGLTVHNLDKIMDGNLDDIIDALATREQAEKLQKLNT